MFFLDLGDHGSPHISLYVKIAYHANHWKMILNIKRISGTVQIVFKRYSWKLKNTKLPNRTFEQLLFRGGPFILAVSPLRNFDKNSKINQYNKHMNKQNKNNDNLHWRKWWKPNKANVFKCAEGLFFCRDACCICY